jgi:hypothetical protein
VVAGWELPTALEMVETRFRAACSGSRPLRMRVPGLPGRAGRMPVVLTALREVLLGRDPELPPVPGEAVEVCWALLVRRAQGFGGPWVLAVAGMLLPCLRAKHAQLIRCLDPWRDAWLAAEIESAMLAGLYEHLVRVEATCGRLPARLCWAAYRAGRKVRDAEVTWARTHVGFTDSAIPAAPYGHPDLILAHAVTGGLLSAAEADLIGRTRLEQTTMAEVAAELGLTYEAVKRRRSRAERKLVTALGEGTLSRYGYWPPATATGTAPAADPRACRVARRTGATRTQAVPRATGTTGSVAAPALPSRAA